MTTSVEGTGKTIEKAVENALLELKVPREDVDIKVLSEGGIFKKAKVIVSISEDALAKYQKHKKFVEEEKELEKQEKFEDKEDKAKKEEKKENKKQEKAKEKEIKKEEKSLEKEEKKLEKEEEEKKIEKEKYCDPEEFLKELFEVLNKEVEITTLEDDKYITYMVAGENLGEVIGHRGEGYYALNTLLKQVAKKGDKKILLDVGSFREKRVESLTQMAKRLANKVAKTGRFIKLDPMNPSDRRIIHTALQDDNRVTTLSKGSEPHRQVIIFPKGDE